jgi:glycerol-1-phosphate dehydrogenase [NAD(P)+]
MARAVDACMAAAPGLAGRDAGAVEGLMRGLVLAGIAMQMVGDSRPASGCEHHIAHFLEMRDMARGRRATLHGDKVGVAELVALRLYEKFFSPDQPVVRNTEGSAAWEAAMWRDLGGFAETLIGPRCSAAYEDDSLRQRILEGAAAGWQAMRAEAALLPALRKQGEEYIRLAGGPVRPADLGYGREDILLALKYAMELRPRFTVLRLAHLSGRLEGLAEELADEFC